MLVSSRIFSARSMCVERSSNELIAQRERTLFLPVQTGNRLYCVNY